MIKKYLTFSVVLLLFVFTTSCDKKGTDEPSVESEETEITEETNEEPEPPSSPREQAEGQVGDISIKIDYGSPSVRNRVIWGGLEEYGKIWRAGANETTNIAFTSDVMIGGTAVAAGKYGFFIMPNENSDWTVILNTAYSRDEHGIWGAMGYSEDNDVARVNVTPEWSEDIQERLNYSVSDNAINFAWEKVRLSIPVNKP